MKSPDVATAPPAAKIESVKAPPIVSAPDRILNTSIPQNDRIQAIAAAPNLDALMGGAGSGVGFNEFAGVKVDVKPPIGVDGASLNPDRVPGIPTAAENQKTNVAQDGTGVNGSEFSQQKISPVGIEGGPRAAAQTAENNQTPITQVDNQSAVQTEQKTVTAQQNVDSTLKAPENNERADVDYKAADGTISYPLTHPDYAIYQEVIDNANGVPLKTAEFNQKVTELKAQKAAAAEKANQPPLASESETDPVRKAELRWQEELAKNNGQTTGESTKATTETTEQAQGKVEELKSEAKTETVDEKTAKINQLKSELDDPNSKLTAEERAARMKEVRDLSKQPEQRQADLEAKFKADPTSFSDDEINELAGLQSQEKSGVLPEERKTQITQELESLATNILSNEGNPAENFAKLHKLTAELNGIKQDERAQAQGKAFVEAYLKANDKINNKETAREQAIGRILTQIMALEAQLIAAPKAIEETRKTRNGIVKERDAAKVDLDNTPLESEAHAQKRAVHSAKVQEAEHLRSVIFYQKNMTLEYKKQIRWLEYDLDRLQGTANLGQWVKAVGNGLMVNIELRLLEDLDNED